MAAGAGPAEQLSDFGGQRFGLRFGEQILAPVVHQGELPEIGAGAQRPFHGLLSGGGVAADGIIEGEREAGFGHLGLAGDERVELPPAHGLALALALQQAQPLRPQKSRGCSV